MEDSRSDAELLTALRAGDGDAYASLWKRHVGPAYRYAERLYRSRADDLVSDSFLAIYQLVTTSSKGPEFAFRSYLKAVMRNTAIRWSKEANHVVEAVNLEIIDHRDALSIIENESNAGDLLSAFQTLPERWQRVLWLAEVAETGRPEIARELGIKPNAVSALQRRARTGLKFQWLSQQIPTALRDDTEHAARLIPRYLTDLNDAEATTEVTAHIETCETCDELLHGMRGAAARLQSTTLAAVGFGALGTVVPAAASLSSGVAVTTVAMAAGTGIGITTGILATGVSVLTIGGLILTSWLTGLPTAEPAAKPADALTTEVPAVITENLPDVITPDLVSVPALLPTLPRIGRWNDDPNIDSIDLISDPALLPNLPTRPSPDVTIPLPGEGQSETLTPGVTTPSAYSDYLAPVITGKTTPGSSIAVEVAGARYSAPVAEDGSWSFDPRGLQPSAGTHSYRVWAYDATTESPISTGEFTVLPIVVEGFEGITGFEDMLASEASTTGLVIAVTGPANGTIYVSTMEGHSAMIPLDATGHAVKRLRMNSWGWYYFTFRALDDESYWGPAAEAALDVYDPDVLHSPWGPDAEEMTFDFTTP
ncbi:sigma-70 family RNA polymerase sigma factor [Microbacterium sp. LWH12-1.2]|uniref:sigma-70 family RNA polymerase sigma factor n=1 Tax=Microbacterium sp. LWH12-1.2 TaxID=3135259 RepID=UPI0034390EBB